MPTMKTHRGPARKGSKLPSAPAEDEAPAPVAAPRGRGRPRKTQPSGDQEESTAPSAKTPKKALPTTTRVTRAQAQAQCGTPVAGAVVVAPGTGQTEAPVSQPPYLSIPARPQLTPKRPLSPVESAVVRERPPSRTSRRLMRPKRLMAMPSMTPRTTTRTMLTTMTPSSPWLWLLEREVDLPRSSPPFRRPRLSPNPRREREDPAALPRRARSRLLWSMYR